MVLKFVRIISVSTFCVSLLPAALQAEVPQRQPQPSAPEVANTKNSNEPENKNLYLFAHEIRSFIHKAKLISQTPDAEKRKLELDQLPVIATRGSKIYFSEETSANKKDLDQFLGKSLRDNPDLQPYYIYLGNAFAAEALELVNQYKAQQKHVRNIGVVGGTVLGILLAGGYIFVKVSVLGKSATLVDALIGTTAIGGGIALGLGGGLLYAYNLPVDTSIKNAQDFELHYPEGRDFVKDITRSTEDLSFEISEIDERRVND